MCSRSRERAAVAALVTLVVAACSTDHAHEDRRVPARAGQATPAVTTSLAAGPPRRDAPIANPFEGNVHAIEEGRRYYAWFNCAGCHGEIGGGSIGPPLRDRDWIYGGAPLQVYSSIVQGRPNGMPSYRDRLPEDVTWKLVAFVTALGDGGREQPGAAAADPEQARPRAPHDEERHDDD